MFTVNLKMAGIAEDILSHGGYVPQMAKAKYYGCQKTAGSRPNKIACNFTKHKAYVTKGFSYIVYLFWAVVLRFVLKIIVC
jgi:hypothetical protein